MYCTVRVPDRRIRTNFQISNQKRSISFEANDPGPSLSGSIWLVLPPTRLTRLEKKIDPPYPAVYSRFKQQGVRHMKNGHSKMDLSLKFMLKSFEISVSRIRSRIALFRDGVASALQINKEYRH